MARIEPIWRHEELIPVIGEWHWTEWGHSDPTGSLESWTAGLAKRKGINAIPTSFVALSDSDQAIGSVVLVEHDMSTHHELSPWLAGLYVVPDQRRRGIGTKLVIHATKCAQAMGYSHLYLHTSTAAQMYTRLGWRFLLSEHYEGEPVDVMVYAA